MVCKTDCIYNEDDFVQQGETMNELTVTITLCEYRNLLQEIVRQDLTIDTKNEEIETLKEENKKLKDCIAVCKMPEWIQKISRAFSEESDDETELNEEDSQPQEERDNF